MRRQATARATFPASNGSVSLRKGLGKCVRSAHLGCLLHGSGNCFAVKTANHHLKFQIFFHWFAAHTFLIGLHKADVREIFVSGNFGQNACRLRDFNRQQVDIFRQAGVLVLAFWVLHIITRWLLRKISSSNLVAWYVGIMTWLQRCKSARRRSAGCFCQ